MNATSNATMAVNAIINISKETGLVGMMQQLNNHALSGMLGIVFIVMIFIVLFITLKGRGSETADAFIASSFVGFLTAMILRGMSLIGDWMFYITIILLIAGGLIAAFKKN